VCEREREREGERWVFQQPGKEGSAITAVLAGAAGFGMSFPVGLNSVSLGALVALPLLLSMLAAKVLLYASQVAQSARRVVMHTGGLRADVDALANLLAGPLPQLPGQVMAPSVQLQVLIPLKPFVTNLAHKSIGRHQCSRRQRYHLCLWVCTKTIPTLNNGFSSSSSSSS